MTNWLIVDAVNNNLPHPENSFTPTTIGLIILGLIIMFVIIYKISKHSKAREQDDDLQAD